MCRPSATFVLTVSGATPVTECPAEGACSEHQRPLGRESILLQTSGASLRQQAVTEEDGKSEVNYDDHSEEVDDAAMNPHDEERLSSNGTLNFLSEASKRGAKQASEDYTARENACCRDAYMFGWETAKLALDIKNREVSFWDMMERFDEAMVYRYGYGEAKRKSEYAAAGLSDPTLAQRLGKKAVDGGADYKERKKELKACKGYVNMKNTAYNGAIMRDSQLDELPPTEPVDLDFKIAAKPHADKFCEDRFEKPKPGNLEEVMCYHYWCHGTFLFGYHLESLALSAYHGVPYYDLMDINDWVSRLARGAISYRTQGKPSAKKKQKNECADTSSTWTGAVQKGAVKMRQVYNPESAFAPFPAHWEAC